MAGPYFTNPGLHKLEVEATFYKGDGAIIDTNSKVQKFIKEVDVKSEFPEYVTNGVPKAFIPPHSTINPNIPEGTEEHIRGCLGTKLV